MTDEKQTFYKIRMTSRSNLGDFRKYWYHSRKTSSWESESAAKQIVSQIQASFIRSMIHYCNGSIPHAFSYGNPEIVEFEAVPVKTSSYCNDVNGKEIDKFRTTCPEVFPENWDQ